MKSVYLCATGIKLTQTSFVRRYDSLFLILFSLQKFLFIFIRLNELHILFHEDQLPRSLHGSPKNDIYDMVT
jgi:hypothetical protein